MQSGIDPARYRQSVAHIQERIREGDCYQVNYTFPLHFSWFGHPLALYAALRQHQPVRYGGLVLSRKRALLSLSPELFLERRGERLTTRPMKGTAPRHSDPEQLRHSVKNRAENLMIVDLLRNDLGRIADTGSVRVDSLFNIEAYPSVWQMTSQISASVTQARTAGIFRALFPCGSITGAPKISAMHIAADLEARPRGLYTGALGWLAPNGDFRFNVAIRTLELAPDHGGQLGVGSGIVSDSQAEEEWRECLLKADFLTRHDPGLLLIETLRAEDGHYPRLDRHLARLAASAAWLGFACDREQIRSTLLSLAQTGQWRVRITLAKNGALTTRCTPLVEEKRLGRLAKLADCFIDSRQPLRRHKTTVRACYDEALRRLPENPALFDIVFCNERGEIAEGARSTVFVARDGVLLTPPGDSGALPGVLRAELLASGQAREHVLYPTDLQDGFWLGNALHGLIPVRLDSETRPAPESV